MKNFHDPSTNILLERDDKLEKIFNPKNVAVIGASEKSNSVGRTILWNLLSTPFGGTIFPVNPKRNSILGIKAYPSISKVPAKIDLAVIATPSKTVLDVMKECVRAKVEGVIIISAGFREIGEEGAKLEEEIKKIAAKAKIRIIGPNCLGVMNPINGLNATFAADMALKGNVAFISQSGALCTAVLDWSLKEKVGFSAFVSIGTMMDVNWGDLINYFGNDPETKSILIYMESVGDPRSFLSAAKEVALTKPIILIKAGKTTESMQAAVSHTGALAESNEVLNAAFKRVGILRVDSIEDLFNMAEILSKQPIPKGPYLSIITNAGGPGVIATDALIESGGKLAKISDESFENLNKFLPGAWSKNNPIDILGDAGPDLFAKTVQEVCRDDNSNGILIILTPQNMTDATMVALKLKELSLNLNKPLLTSWMGGDRVKEGSNILNRTSIPVFEYPDNACRAFSYMWEYSCNLSSIYQTPLASDEVGEETQKRHKKIKKLLENIQKSNRTLLNEYESKKILQEFGIPTVSTFLAKNETEAVKFAEKIGYPVVLKLSSTTVTHKLQMGGVKLNLIDKESVKKAYKEIYQSTKKYFEGVTVQPMVKMGGHEVIIGSSIDPVFGPILLFGMGGSLVEVFKDSALGLPPLNSTLAFRIMKQTKIYKALKNNKEIDLNQLAAIFVKFSNLISQYSIIKECDINPLVISKDILALDARILLHEKRETLPKLAIRPYPFQYAKSIDSAILRPIRPEDELVVIDFFKQLSKKTILNRYLKDINYEDLIARDRLIRVCCVDYDREIVILAENKENRKEILALARLSKFASIKKGFFSLLVKDTWQNKGLGKGILSHLIKIAQEEGLKSIEATLLIENKAMQSICKKLGFNFTHNEDKKTITAMLKL